MSGQRQADNKMRSLRRLLSGCVLLSSTVSVRMCRSSRSAAFRTKHTLFRSAASIASLHAGVEPSRADQDRRWEVVGWMGGGGQSMMNGGGGALYYSVDPAPGHMVEKNDSCTSWKCKCLPL